MLAPLTVVEKFLVGDSRTWSEWKNYLREKGIEVKESQTDSEFDKTVFDISEVRTQLTLCKCELIELDKIEDPNDWFEEFQTLQKNPPQEGDILVTEDGSLIRVTIEMNSGRPPFLYTRAYVPDSVGCKLGWFAQSVKKDFLHGWKVIVTPRSRTEIMRTMDIRQPFIAVKEITIVRISGTGQSLLGEVTKFA